MTNTESPAPRTVTIGRGVAVHAVGTFGTLCADLVRPGHSAARFHDAPGPVTCKKCRRILGYDAPAAPAPAAAPAAPAGEFPAEKLARIRAMRTEVARLLKAGDREAAIELDAKIPRA